MARFTAVLILAAVSLIVIASVMQDVDAGAVRVGDRGMCRGYAVFFVKNCHSRLR